MHSNKFVGNQRVSIQQWLTLVRARAISNQQKLEQLRHGVAFDHVLRNAGALKNKGGKGVSKEIEKDVAWLSSPNNHLVTFFDESYPANLREICDPPMVLFASGNLALLNEPSVAIVGSRRPSTSSLATAERLAKGLAQLGIVITSGMALGVDGCSHESSLSVQGDTIAVLGGAFDKLYPSRHRDLFERLKKHGLVLSEYPLGVAPSKYSFPKRNRIISGLSQGTIIIEAAEKSGTLVTARLAVEQNRELMVVPGPAMSAQYKGSHRLLQQGAALVCDIDDVLQLLHCELKPHCERVVNSNSQIPQEPSMLLRCIHHESTSFDELIKVSGMDINQLSSELMNLEIQGLIKKEFDGGYVKLIP